MSSSLDGPSSVHSAGQEPKSSVRQRESAPPQRQPVALRVGDIVRGTVVDLISPSMARVELPSGIVDASVPVGQLMRGDSVLFRVQAVEPSTVLSIHAVAGGATGQHETDIVRILGLQMSPVALEAVRTLRSMRPALTAADIRDVLAGLSIAPVTASLREQIEVIGRMLDAGVPVEPKFYAMMESLFVGGKQIKQHLSTLRGAEQASSGSALESLLATVQRSLDSARDLFRRFSMAPNDESSIYSILGRLTAELSADGPTALPMREAADKIMATLEAQQLYNIFALQHQAALVFHVVLPIGTDLIAGRLEVEIDKPGTKEGPQAFRITTDMSALGEVTASGFAVKKMISLTILANAHEDVELIEQHRDELARGLNSAGFVLQSLAVRDRIDGEDTFPRMLQRVNLVV